MTVKGIFGFLISVYFFIASSAWAGPLFGYTHIQPSPLTLPAGKLVYGTSVALGVTDFLEVGTNVIRDIYKFYNANAKLSIVDYPTFAFSPFVGFEHYNYKDIADRNPNLSVTSWLPGAVTAYELVPSTLALFVAGNLNFTKTKLVTADDLTTSGFIRGASIGSDLTWAYNPPSKKKTIGNALSTGVSYDITYKLFGVGISHHWPGFHLGVHYYPNATRFPIQPIIAGGGAVDL